MEENLQRDSLEDFLKKSFEDFERQPADGMWDKISAGLDAPTTAPTAPIVRPITSALTFKKWHLGLAAVLLLGIVGWQHFYFQKKINGLAEQVEQQKLEQIEQQKTEQNATPNFEKEQAAQMGGTTDETFSNPNLKAKNQAGGKAAETSEHIENQEFDKNFPTKDLKNNFQKNTFQNQPMEQANANFSVEKSTEKNGAQPTPPTDLVKNEQPEKGENPASKNAALPDEKKPSPEKPADPSSEILKKTEWAAVEPLPGGARVKNWLPTQPKIHFASLPMIRPAAQRNGWSLGIHSAVLATRATAKFERTKFPDPKDKGKQIAQDGSIAGLTWLAGIGLEKNLTRNLSFVTGANFKQTELTSSHSAEFKFRERRGGPGGGGGHHGGGPKGDHEHDFNVNLNTGGGSVAVEFRVAEVDSSAPGKIDDDEKLKFETTTRQKTQWISVPLAMKYSLGKGRLRANLKAGLAANFLIFNDFELTDLRVDNKKFNVEPHKPDQKAANPLRAITFDWLASAGLEYRLNRHLSVAAEPMLLGNLSDYQSLDFAKTSNFSAGLNLGLNYRF